MKTYPCFFSTIFCLAFCLNVEAQVLERKGSLGAVIAHNADTTRVLVERVLPNSTAESLSLEAGDEVLTVNGEKMINPADLIEVTSMWRAGDLVEMDLIRAGQILKLIAEVIAKPKETSIHGDVIYGQVDFEQERLRSILILPHEVVNPPVLFYLQGYGCASQDYYHSPHPVKSFIEDIGYANI